MSAERRVPTLYTISHRLQHEGFQNPAHYAALISGDLVARLRRTEVKGSLPPDGPAIVVANHSSGLDPAMLTWLGERAGRSIRIAARDTLLHPEIEEEEEVLIRTGKKDDLLNTTPGWKRQAMAKVIELTGNPIPVHRGKPAPSFFKEVRQTLRSGQMFGIFLQETRSPQNDLSKAMNGAAYIARLNPEVPTYLVGITDIAMTKETFFHPKAFISQPLSYSEVNPDRQFSDEQVTEKLKHWMSQLIGKK
jgi:1-acyl-sn-glycerol-3-phosphate acyltransferase